mgnify:CR=1 FL=1
MKQLVFGLTLITTIIVFQFCSSSKKAQNTVATTSYSSHVQSIVINNCSPCHVGANAKQTSLSSYDAVKNNIDNILARIHKNPGEKGFMPLKKPKLSDSTIQVFEKWKAEGFAQ